MRAALVAIAVVAAACSGGESTADATATGDPDAASAEGAAPAEDGAADGGAGDAEPDGTAAAGEAADGGAGVEGEDAEDTDGAPAATEAELVPLPAQPEGVDFPTEAWVEADLTDHLSPEAAAEVGAVIDAAFDDDAPYGTIEAVLVVSGGELVAESYGRGWTADQVHVSWSVGKSVTHALLGVASRDGLIDVFAPAAVPEWPEGDPRADITPDQLARMSSGLAWDESFNAFALVTGADRSEVALAQIERDPVAEPDQVFNYSTGSTAVNARILGDIIGTGEAFGDWADAELFDPIGIRSAELTYDGSDYFVGGYGANMTARDFARFGLLYQRDGVWDGRRILPEGWVDYGRTPSVTAEDYGAGFWLRDDSFAAAGFLGQRVVMIPESDVVIVVLANEQADVPITELILDLGAPFAGSSAAG